MEPDTAAETGLGVDRWSLVSSAQDDRRLFPLRFFTSAAIKETFSPSTPYEPLVFSASCTQRLVCSSELRLNAVHSKACYYPSGSWSVAKSMVWDSYWVK